MHPDVQKSFSPTAEQMLLFPTPWRLLHKVRRISVPRTELLRPAVSVGLGCYKYNHGLCLLLCERHLETDPVFFR